MSVIAEIIT